MRNSAPRAGIIVFGFACLVHPAMADDWPRFRGPNGDGIAPNANPPTEWSDDKNLQWRTKLPGPGSSSPIVVGQRVFVTCYSGYGISEQNVGQIENLKRHLVCVDRESGKILWDKDIPARQPEDPFRGFITEHGYASSTPVSDGERVYVMFGKTGVLAFDMDGKFLWRQDVGTESNEKRWGSAASPILYKNMLIVNASYESESIRAFHKTTGKPLWVTKTPKLAYTYCTPEIAPISGGKTELIVAVPGQVWGLYPSNGRLKWATVSNLTGNVAPSPIVAKSVVFIFGGYRTKGSMAIRTGGKGDVTKSHVAWTSNESSYVATPVLHKAKLYWVNDRAVAYCMDARTAKVLTKKRVVYTGGRQREVYASPVLAKDRLYIVTRQNGTYVLSADSEMKILGKGWFESDQTDFSATPAISDNQLFLRSRQYLYCVGK